MEKQIQLKISRYSFVFSDKGRHYLYNTLSNALLEVDEELATLIKDVKSKNMQLPQDLDETMTNQLKTNRFITENDEDDFLIYKSVIQSQRNSRSGAVFTIVPTMDCCFSCHYCFEKCKRPSYMDENVMKGITKYIASQTQTNYVGVTWFGGEPLMAVDEMEKLYRKIRRILKGKQYSSNIITTGFHLNEENIRALQRMKVTEMQITLDGMKDTHNSIKFTEGCDDAFSVVLENIERTCRLAPEIHIVVRTNLTRSSAHEYEELQRMIRTRFAGKNLNIAPAFVMDRSNCGKTIDPDFFSTKEYPDYIIGLSKLGIDSPQARYPENHFTECAIRNPNSLAFDPEGNIYKCWEHIGDDKYAIGRINKKGVIENVNRTLLNRQLYGADPLDDPQCRECPYLPICFGGCPIHRIENTFMDGQNDCCTYYKDHMKEFIMQHLQMKERLAKNTQKLP